MTGRDMCADPSQVALMMFVRMRDLAFETMDPPHVDWIKRT